MRRDFSLEGSLLSGLRSVDDEDVDSHDTTLAFTTGRGAASEAARQGTYPTNPDPTTPMTEYLIGTADGERLTPAGHHNAGERTGRPSPPSTASACLSSTPPNAPE